MKAIRSWHVTTAHYITMFREIANLSFSEYHDLRKQIDVPKVINFDGTDALTELRKGLASKGYEKEVELTDERFLREHHGCKTEEAWESFWSKFCANHNLDPRNDAL